MHQTFYIDIDEEITSVVERLRKARAGEVIIVVPKRALLIQSIVNLRILKKEADESGLQLMMVTQDKLGKILIEKAGIFVQQKMDNLSDEEIDLHEEERVVGDDNFANNEARELEKKNYRLDKIGSKDYFGEGSDGETGEVAIAHKKNVPKNKKSEKENLINVELVTDIGKEIKKEKSGASMDLKMAASRENEVSSKPTVFSNSDLRREFSPVKEDQLSLKDKRIDDFFYHSGNAMEKSKKIEKKDLKDFNISTKIHKRFWIFGVFFSVVILGIAAYLFIPNAKVIISTETEIKNIDSEILGDTNARSVDYENGIIPIKLVATNEELVKSFPATGSKTVSNQKARGTITIYNEYDANPQPLVATTRFLTADGKLFRLTSSVTVPGMSKVNGEMKPGTVEAQIAADQSGEDYNIKPTEFKIPGFQSSGEKYNKFYAKSEKAMTGGGNGVGESKFVTAEDITKAKNETLAELEKTINQKIKASNGEDMMLIDGAVQKDEAVYKLSNSQNDVADSFQVTVQMKASALIFRSGDLKEVVAKMIAKSGNAEKGIEIESINFDFGKPNVDFEKGTMDIKFHAKGKANPNLDLDVIKKEILGKNEDGLKEYLSTFADIEKVEVSYWPSYINSRIPFRAGQVELGLDNK